MVEEKTSFGIMKTDDDNCTTLSYTLACHCGSPDCAVRIDYEVEEEGFYISMCFNKKLIWNYNSGISYWTEQSLFRKYIQRPAQILSARLKAAARLMFTGYIEVVGDIILQDHRHIQAISDGLQEAHKIMKERLEKAKQKSGESQKAKE